MLQAKDSPNQCSDAFSSKSCNFIGNSQSKWSPSFTHHAEFEGTQTASKDFHLQPQTKAEESAFEGQEKGSPKGTSNSVDGAKQEECWNHKNSEESEELIIHNPTAFGMSLHNYQAILEKDDRDLENSEEVLQFPVEIKVETNGQDEAISIDDDDADPPIKSKSESFEEIK